MLEPEPYRNNSAFGTELHCTKAGLGAGDKENKSLTKKEYKRAPLFSLLFPLCCGGLGFPFFILFLPFPFSIQHLSTSSFWQHSSDHFPPTPLPWPNFLTFHSLLHIPSAQVRTVSSQGHFSPLDIYLFSQQQMRLVHWAPIEASRLLPPFTSPFFYLLRALVFSLFSWEMTWLVTESGRIGKEGVPQHKFCHHFFFFFTLSRFFFLFTMNARYRNEQQKYNEELAAREGIVPLSLSLAREARRRYSFSIENRRLGDFFERTDWTDFMTTITKNRLRRVKRETV